MLHSKSFMKKTRSGKVLKVVREHYLRDDLPCGSQLCQQCQKMVIENGTESTSTLTQFKLAEDAPYYMVFDTNVVLHQIDAIEHKSVTNVIIPKTVEEEVKHRQQHTHTRLREIITNLKKHFVVFDNEHHQDTFVERLPNESPNDRNDRAIRVTCSWYMKHLPEKKIILVTNDRDNKEKAKAEGIQAMTIEEYAESVKNESPELIDILVRPDESGDALDKDKKIAFDEHKTKNEIEAGLKTGRYYQGPLRMNRDNYLEGNVPSQGLDEEILIQGLQNLNRAIDGDIVAVELLPKDQWTRPSTRFIADEGDSAGKVSETSAADNAATTITTTTTANADGTGMRPSGKIVGVIKANWKPYCGSLENRKGGGQPLFVPVNKKIPKIRIKTKQAESLMNKRIVVCIDSWDRNSRYPSGHYVKTLGAVGDKDVETEVLLIHHDVPYHPFGDAVLACLPQNDWIADNDPDTKQPHRRDFRDICVVSVDPPGCTDIDDALHVTLLPNGNYQVGVHIADVTHFVHQDTAIDKEAAERSTTVYLVNRRIDMLPKLLGENLCSLRSNVDRFAFSVIWELTPNAEIVSAEYTKSIIRSRASLTYEQAQLRIDDKRMTDEISEGLRNLNRLAKILRKRRFDSGALELASPEVKFIKDEETQNPIDVEMYQLRETNAMVEEFMLLANISVAEKIYNHFPNFAILRRHPVPAEKSFQPLLEAAGQLGIALNVENSKALSESLSNAKFDQDPYLNTLLRIMTTRCMTQAVYFSSGSVPRDQFLHYGLATPIYTHFTSPIRRYADVIVHRLLGCAIGVYTLSMNVDNHKISKLCETINFRHRMAQHASRSSVELHTVVFFRGKTFVEEGYVTRVKANGFSVLIPKYGVEDTVHVSTEGDNKEFNYDDKTQSLSKDGSDAIRMFKKVKIEITVDEEKQELRLHCLDPPIHLPSDDSAESATKRKGEEVKKSPISVSKKAKRSNILKNNN